MKENAGRKPGGVVVGDQRAGKTEAEAGIERAWLGQVSRG